jgi:hypothetical protein
VTKSVTLSENLILQITHCTFRGCVCGIVSGVIAGAIGSLVYWVSTKNAYQALYARVTLDMLVPGDVFMYGIPIGLTIGIITGLHAGIFRNYYPKSIVWVVLTVFGAVTGFWLSGKHPNNFYVFAFEVGFITLVTSWLAHRFTMHEYQNDNSKLKRMFFTGICSITGLLCVFIIVYIYFYILHELASLPS